MKKFLVAGIIVGVGLLMTSTSLAAPSYFTRSTLNDSTATTTAAFMTPGTGTSTISFVSADADYSNLYINLYASTSASILNWKYQYSNNNVDWYDEDAIASSVTLASGDQAVFHASSTVTHVWTTGNTVSSTTRKVLAMPNIVAGWTRVIFSVPIGSENSTIYAEVLPKRLPQ